MEEITVVGGGLSGLVAAITAAEAGHRVRVLEAQRRLGGRARSTKPPYVANFGGHVIYGDGPWLPWLAERNLTPPHAGYPLGGLRFRSAGILHKAPPSAAVRAWFKLRGSPAPADISFRDWASSLADESAAELLCAAAGVFSFDHDPGRLSAEFVWSRLERVVRKGRTVTYICGGWSTLVASLETHALRLGVRIETGRAVDAVPPAPAILAVPLASAGKIIRDHSLRWETTRTALLDVAVEKRRGDPFIVWDLDAPGWIERYSRPDPTLAPDGISLIQAQTGLRPTEDLDSGIAGLEQLLDDSFPQWGTRTMWRRNNISEGETGALDLPGTTWTDQPAIDRGGGVFLTGDEVVAPGLLSEVAITSAIKAAAGAIAWLERGRARRKAKAV